MSEEGVNESSRPRREVSSGEEHDRKFYFAHGASLRVHGTIGDLDEITQRLGVVPTHVHRRGDRRRGPDSPTYKQDMWMYTTPMDEAEPLGVHIDALWDTFRERKQYLLQLKNDLTVDVYLTYRSNCDHAGVEVPHESLEIFRELQVPFGLSITVV